MHYYKFNVADWVMNTSHLSLEEEAVYLRLVNHYYDSEQPIPLETHSVTRRLRLASHSETVDVVLKEFFVKTDEGWIHSKCDKLLAEYHARAERNRQNGSKGGRKPKDEKPEVETEEKPSGLEVGSQKEPTLVNHKLLTTNQELETNKEPMSSKPDTVVEIFDYWKEVMQKKANTTLSTKRKTKIKQRLKDGYSIEEIKQAIFNCSNTPHNMGINDRNQKFDDIELICRSAENLERFRDNPGGNHGTNQQRNAGTGRKLNAVEENNARLLEKYGNTTPHSERSINQLDDPGVDEYEVSGSLREQVGLSGVTIDMGSGNICDDGATDPNCGK